MYVGKSVPSCNWSCSGVVFRFIFLLNASSCIQTKAANSPLIMNIHSCNEVFFLLFIPKIILLLWSPNVSTWRSSYEKKDVSRGGLFTLITFVSDWWGNPCVFPHKLAPSSILAFLWKRTPARSVFFVVSSVVGEFTHFPFPVNTFHGQMWFSLDYNVLGNLQNQLALHIRSVCNYFYQV